MKLTRGDIKQLREMTNELVAWRIASDVARRPEKAVFLQLRRESHRMALEILLKCSLDQETRAELARNPKLLKYIL